MCVCVCVPPQETCGFSALRLEYTKDDKVYLCVWNNLTESNANALSVHNRFQLYPHSDSPVAWFGSEKREDGRIRKAQRDNIVIEIKVKQSSRLLRLNEPIGMLEVYAQNTMAPAQRRITWGFYIRISGLFKLQLTAGGGNLVSSIKQGSARNAPLNA